MKSSIGQIAITKAIFHGIPAKGDVASPSIAARHSVCDMEPSAKSEIERRLRKVLIHSGRQVVENSSVESKTPAIVKDLLTVEDADFIAKSQELAQTLLDAQTRRNPSGMLFVAECLAGGSPSIMLVKVEQESGMLVEDSTEPGGVQAVRYLERLLLTSKSKVYKVALFDSADLVDDVLYGWAADVQMSGSEVAAFFLRAYLGCRLLGDPKELTSQFHQHAQAWVNKFVKDPDLRARYQMAIATEMLSERKTVSVRGFANSNLRQADHDPFVNYLSDHGVPVKMFDKDVSLIEPKLKRFSIAFESGVLITAPNSTYGDVIKIERVDGPISRVVIQDIMGDIKGRGVAGGSRPKEVDSGSAPMDASEG
ncbi:nucleoid-associated protein [Actinoplanes sp. NPDC048791]|uniref:nucleoid-associated protein n=1 Tax=Actinoplanes sp. NPDC048791 TaxID=3154623 RepID=UPI00340427FC